MIPGPRPIQLGYDLNELTTVVYNRPRLDTEGSIVRAVLTEASAPEEQIIHAAKLDLWRPADPKDVLDLDKIPGFPLLAMREGGISSTQRTIGIARFRWFIYDRMDEGYWRINEIIPLLARAYAAAPLKFTTRGVIKEVVVSDPSGATQDASLGLRLRYVTVSMLVA